MTVFTQLFEKCPKISFREACRYAGISGEAPRETKNDILSVISELEKISRPKACYTKTSVEIHGKTVDFGLFKAESEKLAINLKNCSEAFLFASTLGSETDMLINKYSRIKPLKALYYQAVGAAAIESVCDFLCDRVFTNIAGEKKGLRPRFSPGYGDLCISLQKEFVRALDCRRKIGLYLSDGGFLLPSKSVTAIVGVTDEKESCKSGCEICENKMCEFRRENEQKE